EAETGRHVRTEPAAVRAADGDSDDQVAHHVDHTVTAEIRGRAEKARAVAEVDLAAEDAAAHRTRGHAEACPTVVEHVATLEADAAVCRHPRTDIAVGARLSWRP